MKTIRLLPLLVLSGAAMLVSARAQLVHLAFRDFDGSVIFRANSALIPWDHTGGEITRLDFYYDPLADTTGGTLDPSKNVWRAYVKSYGGLGDFTITRPLDQIYASDSWLTFAYNNVDPQQWGSLDFFVNLAPPNLSPGAPVPPLTFGESFVHLSGGDSFFDIKNLGEAYGYGGYHYAKAEMVPGVGLSPVPEPSTYGLCAGALLTGLILKRRRTRTRNLARESHE